MGCHPSQLTISRVFYGFFWFSHGFSTGFRPRFWWPKKFGLRSAEVKTTGTFASNRCWDWSGKVAYCGATRSIPKGETPLKPYKVMGISWDYHWNIMGYSWDIEWNYSIVFCVMSRFFFAKLVQKMSAWGKTIFFLGVIGYLRSSRGVLIKTMRDPYPLVMTNIAMV